MFSGGSWWNLPDILLQIRQYATLYVTVTGGEPLAQKSCITLLKNLCDEGFIVSLETSGAISVACVDARVKKIIDIKTPGSQEVDKNLFENFKYLFSEDEIKFVICSKEDFIWAMQIMQEYELDKKCHILFSPSYQQISARELAEWVLESKLNVRLQVQLHKILWGEERGR